jgi:Holliday junction resolvase-like predicted endonuclease
VIYGFHEVVIYIYIAFITFQTIEHKKMMRNGEILSVDVSLKNEQSLSTHYGKVGRRKLAKIYALKNMYFLKQDVFDFIFINNKIYIFN